MQPFQVDPTDEEQNAKLEQLRTMLQSPMSEQAQYRSPDPYTPQQERAAAQQVAAPGPNLAETLGAAIKRESVTSQVADDMTDYIMRSAGGDQFKLDPNFRIGKLPKEQQQALYKDIPDDLLPQFAEATSLGHAQAIREKLLGAVSAEDILSRAGGTGVGARVIAGIVDPAAIGVFAASDGVLGEAMIGSKATRLARALRTGLVAGGQNAAITAALTSMDPLRHPSDILYSAVTGFGLGSAIGGLSRGLKGTTSADALLGKLGKDASDTLVRREAQDAGLEVTGPTQVHPLVSLEGAGEGSFVRQRMSGAEFGEPTAPPRPVLEAYNKLKEAGSWTPEVQTLYDNLSPDDRAALKATMETNNGGGKQPSTFSGAGGAGFLPSVEEVTSVPNQVLYAQAEQSAYQPKFKKARFDAFASVASSDHAMVSELASRLMPDPVGVSKNGVIQGTTAWDHMTNLYHTNMTRFNQVAGKAFKDWMKENDVSPLHAMDARTQFFDDVGKAVRREPGEYTENVHVNRVADRIRKINLGFLREAQDAGVKGFDEVAANSQYMTRIYSPDKLVQLENTVGTPVLKRMISDAFMRGSDNMKGALDEELAGKVADALVKRLRRKRWGADPELTSMFSADNRQALSNLLRDELGGNVSEDVLKRIEDKAVPDSEGTSPRAKRRLAFDETTRMAVNVNGARHEFGFEDILENNAEELTHLYNRQMSGLIAMAKVGFKGTSDFQSYLNRIRDAGDLVKGLNPDKFEKQMDGLKAFHSAITGAPLQNSMKPGALKDGLRLVRDYNFMRVMNQVGFAQLAEIGNVLGQTGVRSMLKQMPAFGKIWSRAKSGELSDRLSSEIEGLFAYGTDRLNVTPQNRFETLGSESRVGGALGKVDRLVQAGSRVTNDLSGMSLINNALERMAARAGIQRFADMAAGKWGYKMSDNRLASIGLDAKTTEKILDQMRKHVGTEENPVTGRAVSTLNIDKWDTKTADAFTFAMQRWMRRAVQKNDFADLAVFMHGDLAKTVLQFRNFMSVAWSKQFLHGLAVHDAAAFNSWALSMFFGGLAYTAQTTVNSIGRSDQQDYLAKHLSADKLAEAAFYRTGFSSIIPAAVDPLISTMGYDPIFSYARSTGLSNGLLSNPTLDLINSIGNGVGGTIGSAVNPDQQFSQDQARALLSVLPFQNMTGIRNIQNLMLDDLPKHSQTQE